MLASRAGQLAPTLLPRRWRLARLCSVAVTADRSPPVPSCVPSPTMGTWRRPKRRRAPRGQPRAGTVAGALGWRRTRPRGKLRAGGVGRSGEQPGFNDVAVEWFEYCE
ncbi:hypothetical protein PVAP13_3KG145727 [Panicum virgatum]|uniref:Uncharacterized protein n=1 Tax=Panicum virgatum TaxID=38727 RepID=A0A8T0URC7_PANVG|nr:hypothetical protein PVAP13_3KG145727 [Panicum virgatum]